MTRDLSPYSTRRLLTQKLAIEKTGTSQRAGANESHKWSLDNEIFEAKTENSIANDHRSRLRERGRRYHSQERQLKGTLDDADKVPYGREVSPVPYRNPRETSKETRRKDRVEQRKDGSSERRRDRSRMRNRRDEKEQKRHRSIERQRERSIDKRRSRSRERSQSLSKGHRQSLKERRTDKRKDREQSRDKYKKSRRSRSRSKDTRHRNRTRSNHLSRSPIPYRSRKQHTRSPSLSASPPPKRRRRSRSRSRSRSPGRRSRNSLPSREISFRGLDNSAQPPSKYGGAPPNKEKPNFKTTGLLARHANRVEGTKISLKYHEPAEARKAPPSQPWRIYVFKGEDVLDTIEIWQKSCWLLGRAHEVVDYVLEHPSSSGQHAVIQFRYIEKITEDEFGVTSKRGKVKPYIIDLESSNGTELNGDSIEPSRYLELRDKDILRFAGSEREYVVMLPSSKG